jgi:uncharacterized protein (TIGR00251 family)
VKISVTVKPNSRKESVTLEADGSYTVRANAPPIDGAANERVIELLAEHFGRPKSAVALVSGHRAKKKIFSV